MRARLHLALCEAKGGKIVDALRDNSKALELARVKNDSATLKQVQERVTELLPKLAHVTFQIPTGVSDLQHRLRRPHDPGRAPGRQLHDRSRNAQGPRRGHPARRSRLLRRREGRGRRGPDREREDHAQAGRAHGRPARVHGRREDAGGDPPVPPVGAKAPRRAPRARHERVHGHHRGPRPHARRSAASVVSPTAGWNVGASYIVDVVTAASPDVVSTASRRFADTRHAATATGGYQPGRFGGQVYGSYSSESDYISRTLGAAVTGEFLDKQLTPQLGFSHTWDTIGRSGTSYDVFSNSLNAEEISAGATIIMSPVSLLVLGATAALENGDQSKTYRYIPLFEPGVSVPVGASADAVNSGAVAREGARAAPPRSPALLPRCALRAARARRRRRCASRSASTTTRGASRRAPRTLATSSTCRRAFVSGRTLRFHIQSGATFYKRVYGATLNSDGSATVPSSGPAIASSARCSARRSAAACASRSRIPARSSSSPWSRPRMGSSTTTSTPSTCGRDWPATVRLVSRRISNDESLDHRSRAHWRVVPVVRGPRSVRRGRRRKATRRPASTRASSIAPASPA